MKCLVVMLNRCRLDYLGCYGNDWIATPTFDRLAAEGVVFDHHYAASVAPWRSVRQSLPFDDLLAQLWEKQVTTACIVDERCIPRAGFAGATHWESYQAIRRQNLPMLEQDSLLAGTVQTAIEWLQASAQRTDWLLWLEIGAFIPPWDAAERDDEAILDAEDADALEPWFDPPSGPVSDEPAQARLERTYAGVVGGVDQWLSMLLDFLRESGLLDDVLVVVTSDVGISLGDRGRFDPGVVDLHEEHVHLPLIIRLPKGEQAGRRVHQFTQPEELAATLRQAFGLGDQGLLDLCRGGKGKPREYLASWLNDDQATASLRTREWYLVPRMDAAAYHLFAKPEDRWEVNDLASQHVAVAEHLELARFRHLHGQKPELRAEVLNVQQS